MTMKSSLSFLLVAVIIVSLLTKTTRAASSKNGWIVEEFPKSDNFIGDPDGILNDHVRNILVERIQLISLMNIPSESNSNKEDSSISSSSSSNISPISPIEMAVAIVDKIDLTIPNYRFIWDVDERIDTAAQDFAQRVHNDWGVGHAQDGTGILIFLSVQDRVVYISRGKAFDSLLRDSRIERIIGEMRDLLQRQKYGDGLILGVDMVKYFLEKGEPDWKESILGVEFLTSLYMILIVVYGFYTSCLVRPRRRREARMYAEAESQLSDLDRAQAEALRGQYQPTSCPICLEDFKSDTVGSDDLPIKLLRCGHCFDEKCWSEWVHIGRGHAVTKCPICKKDVGRDLPEELSSIHNNTPTENEATTGDDTLEQEEQQDRAIQRYQQERNFRLTRLHLRYPRYITQSQIQRWSSPTYNGSLVRDESFTESRPRVEEWSSSRSRHQGSSDGRNSSGFGGGTSSGGHGGRF